MGSIWRISKMFKTDPIVLKIKFRDMPTEDIDELVEAKKGVVLPKNENINLSQQKTASRSSMRVLEENVLTQKAQSELVERTRKIPRRPPGTANAAIFTARKNYIRGISPMRSTYSIHSARDKEGKLPIIGEKTFLDITSKSPRSQTRAPIIFKNFVLKSKYVQYLNISLFEV